MSFLVENEHTLSLEPKLCDYCDQACTQTCRCGTNMCAAHERTNAFTCDNARRSNGSQPPHPWSTPCDATFCLLCGFVCDSSSCTDEHRFCASCIEHKAGVYMCVECGALGCLESTEECEECHQTVCHDCLPPPKLDSNAICCSVCTVGAQ